MPTHKKYLIARSDGEMRVVTKRPRLRWDEVAYEVRVNVPDAWGEIKGIIELSMAEPPGDMTVTELLGLPRVEPTGWDEG